MVNNMSKEITIYSQNFKPDNEAVSKEINVILENINGKNVLKLWNIDFNKIKFKFTPKKISYYFLGHILLLPKLIFNSRKGFNHIYTSLGDTLFLPFISKYNTILTSGANCIFDKQKIMRRKKYLDKIKLIIIETELEKNKLEEWGFNKNKIKLIRQGVNLKHFKYKKEKEFKVLFATSPPKKNKFEERGIYLLLDVVQEMKNTKFVFVWRNKHYKKLMFEVKKRNIKNLEIINQQTNMKKIYENISCTIVPFTKFDNHHKLIPLTLIESLASGKPIISTNKTDMVNIVNKEKIGLITNPDKLSLINAINNLKENYEQYQKNCERTAKKYFDEKIFLKKYKKIYQEMKKI